MLPHFFSLIGSDRYLTSAEVERAAEPHPLTAPAWDVYAAQFGAFTGAALDPQFHRLSHPAGCTGAIQLDPGTAVLVVGTGPSLLPAIDGLRRLAGRVRLFTSPRGAEALAAHGLVPDLVLIEHQTPIDAHHSARHLRDRQDVLAACPLVAADWRTPAPLLANVAPQRLFVPAPLPTWGLWPATAVAMAVEAGAARIGLVGVDLGTADRPDPAQAPLVALLGLLARLSPAVSLDCGAGGAPKRGWLTATIDEMAGVKVKGPCAVRLQLAPRGLERLHEAHAGLRELAPVIEGARALRDLALAARAGASIRELALDAGLDEMLRWGADARVRVLLQETLALSFLPRLWRLGVDAGLGPRRWRPLLLGVHELVGQAEALAAAAARERAA